MSTYGPPLFGPSTSGQERERQRQEQETARKKYYKERAKTRALVMARNEKGQPRLGNQVDRILQKLQRERRANNAAADNAAEAANANAL